MEVADLEKKNSYTYVYGGWSKLGKSHFYHNNHDILLLRELTKLGENAYETNLER